MDVAKQVEFLERYYAGLQKAVVEARKQGLDTKLAELRMMVIPHKIKYVRVSEDKKDLENLKVMLHKLEKEIPKKIDKKEK
ncbi:hypothetical protein KY320_01075 [Candidatus Woesearchaeota archaeon]|nr:hypothetical protein [Candidatus Woesearchaeota archaeon]